jgi:hypothetical protein
MADGLKVCIALLSSLFVAILVCYMELSAGDNKAGSYCCNVSKYKCFVSEDYTAVRKTILL